VIILMLYVYYSALIMLVGAEINQVIEWHIPGGKNEGEKIPEVDRQSDVHRLDRESGQNGEGR
jgi:membrane protein